jgi:hypothetical protein
LVACGLLLGGCESYGDLTSDAFYPGRATQTQFLTDGATCGVQADIPRNYEITGIEGTHVARHEIYNRAFTQCMQAHGYARRDLTPNIPYDIDPWPG